MSLLDAAPYPWTDPRAQELHRLLFQAYDRPTSAESLVKRVDWMDPYSIRFEQSVREVWVEILDQASARGALQKLAATVVGDRPEAPVSRFLQQIQQGTLLPLNPEPRGDRGRAIFDDALTRPEALLYAQDLSERVGEIPDLLRSIQNVLSWSAAVCRLEVTAADGISWRGTGFRIEGERILTNHHVAFPPAGRSIVRIRADFRYEQQSDGSIGPSLVCNGDVATVMGNALHDWATFRTLEPLPDTVPVVPLSAARPALEGERAFILQHPSGEPKRLAFVRNRVTRATENRVHYVTDTMEGSSGSPVFGGDGRLIALHHAGGTPQATPAGEPVRKNEGIAATRVREEVG
jgi:hypothetical protein